MDKIEGEMEGQIIFLRLLSEIQPIVGIRNVWPPVDDGRYIIDMRERVYCGYDSKLAQKIFMYIEQKKRVPFLSSFSPKFLYNLDDDTRLSNRIKKQIGI